MFTGIVILLFASVIVPLVMDALLDTAINLEVVIDSKSHVNYDAWQTNAPDSNGDTAIDINYNLFLFDTTNPRFSLERKLYFDPQTFKRN